MAAAIESGGFKPTTHRRHVARVSARQRPDHHDRTTTNLGKITLTTVLARSSNVGAARVALTMEPQEIWRVLAGFGIGRLTDSGYPGESAGRLNDPQHWRQIGQATLAYGYGVSVTPLQLAQAYSAIAADGMLRPVSMLALDKPPPGERVISSSTARALTQMMEAVVSPAGTGKRAAVRNYRVAGKTGTAQKAVGRRPQRRAAHRVLRRLRARDSPAARRRRRDRRAAGRLLRRRRRGAGVLEHRRPARCECSRCRPMRCPRRR